MKSFKDILVEGENYLGKAGLDNVKDDAWYLFEETFNMKRAEYILNKDQEADTNKVSKFFEQIRKRTSNKPLQYITGHQEFMGLDFDVNENVLIPRLDTEVLVETALNIIKKINKEKIRILDLCTGSGCIAISLKKLSEKKVEITASDISAKALEVAKINAKKNDENIEFIESNLFENIEGKYDIIISNPPYIKSKEVLDLMEEVRSYEPNLALDGGEGGLDFYNKITKESVKFLNNYGFLLYEIGYDQSEDIKKIFKDNSFKEIEVLKDLAGLNRVAKGIYMEAEKNV